MNSLEVTTEDSLQDEDEDDKPGMRQLLLWLTLRQCLQHNRMLD